MKWNRWFLSDLAGNLAALLLGCLVLLAVSAVMLRYVVGSPLAWAEEVETLILIWIIMIGAIYAKRNNSLLRMDILYNLMPPRMRHWVTVFQEICHLGIFGLMIVFGYRLALQVGDKGTSLLNIPLYWLYISLPVAGIGMSIITLMQLYDLFRSPEEN